MQDLDATYYGYRDCIKLKNKKGLRSENLLT